MSKVRSRAWTLSLYSCTDNAVPYELRSLAKYIAWYIDDSGLHAFVRFEAPRPQPQKLFKGLNPIWNVTTCYDYNEWAAAAPPLTTLGDNSYVNNLGPRQSIKKKYVKSSLGPRDRIPCPPDTDIDKKPFEFILHQCIYSDALGRFITDGVIDDNKVDTGSDADQSLAI